MQRTRRLAPLLLAAAGVACSTHLGVEFDDGEDFSAYRSWAWLPRPEPGPGSVRAVDRALEARIVAGIERELAARGFVRASEQPPDFFVTYHVKIHRELVLRTEMQAERTLHGNHGMDAYTVASPVRVRRLYERSTLVVDVADGRERQLVWRGRLETRVRGRFEPHVDEALADILERFPPPAGERVRRSPDAGGAGQAAREGHADSLAQLVRGFERMGAQAQRFEGV